MQNYGRVLLPIRSADGWGEAKLERFQNQHQQATGALVLDGQDPVCWHLPAPQGNGALGPTGMLRWEWGLGVCGVVLR